MVLFAAAAARVRRRLPATTAEIGAIAATTALIDAVAAAFLIGRLLTAAAAIIVLVGAATLGRRSLAAATSEVDKAGAAALIRRRVAEPTAEVRAIAKAVCETGHPGWAGAAARYRSARAAVGPGEGTAHPRVEITEVLVRYADLKPAD